MENTKREKAIQIVEEFLNDAESVFKRGKALFGDDFTLSSIPKFSNQNDLQADVISLCENRNLELLLGCDSWMSVFTKIHSFNESDKRIIKPGDYLIIPVDVEETVIDKMVFEKINTEAKIIVVEVSDDKVFFNFDEILFFSAINTENTNSGGFAKSILSKYLNVQFVKIFESVKDSLFSGKDGNIVTLPSYDDVFGNNAFAFYKKTKNRIKTKDNDTHWWWLQTPATAHATYFCYVDDYGGANHNAASYLDGGVSPAFCVA